MVRITEENKETQYILVISFIKYLAFSMLLLFLIIQHNTIELAINNNNFIGGNMLWLISVLIGFPTVVYLIVSYKNR